MAQGRKTGGRTKGTPNKVTSELREAILQAAETAGGDGKLVGYLISLAKNQPKAFALLLGKLLPKDVNVEGELGMRVVIERSFLKPDAS